MKFRWYSKPISVRYADVARSLEGLDVETIKDVKEALENINLKGTTRLAIKTVSPVTIYVDNVNGSDTAGDGSASNPYKTFARALKDVGEFYDADVTIVLKASNVSYGNLDISGITRENVNSVLTIQGEMIVLDSGVVTGFSNAVDDPVYGSLVQVAKITTNKYFQPDQYKHKLLRVYKGGTSYYRIITNNDTNSIYCSYTFPVTFDGTWNWEILDWGTRCDRIYCWSSSSGIVFNFLNVVRPSSGFIVSLRDAGHLTTFNGCRFQAFPNQSQVGFSINRSFMDVNYSYIDANDMNASAIYFWGNGSFAGLYGVIFDNLSVNAISNQYEHAKVVILHGSRFYRGINNPNYGIRMMGGVIFVSDTLYGKNLIDVGSVAGIQLIKGAIIYNRQHFVFGPNVATQFLTHFDLIDGRLLVQSHLGVNITDHDYLNVHSRLQVQGSVATQVTTVSTNTTLGINHHIVLVDASGGNRTITLPDASTCAGRQYVIKKIDSSANIVTVTPQAGQTIDGQSSVVLNTQYQTVTVVSDGNNWYKISG